MYYEARKNEGGSMWRWVIYAVVDGGEREMIQHRSKRSFDTYDEAIMDCMDFMDERSIEAELGEINEGD